MDLIARFRRTVLAALGVDDVPELPTYDRMALYPCEVKKCASDGSTVDVTPDSPRVKPAQGVRVKVGLPGAVAVVQQGARVLLGWEGGDPAKPYVVPSWESGATVTKLVLKATTVYLGDEAGAEELVKKSEFNGHTHKYNPGPGAAAESLVPSTLAVGTSNVKAK